jgi:phosphoribosylformylglycinamidine cyclo-ligase
MVHVTGGGFYDNLPRVLPATVQANINFGSWDIEPVFHWLKEQGELSWPEMLQIFNTGIGYVLIVSEDICEEVMGRLDALHQKAWVIGKIERRQQDDSEQVHVNFPEESECK